MRERILQSHLAQLVGRRAKVDMRQRRARPDPRFISAPRQNSAIAARAWRERRAPKPQSVLPSLPEPGPTPGHSYSARANHNFKNLEFKADVMRRPANSGIYFHTEYQEGGWPAKGYEVQVNNRNRAGGAFMRSR